MNLLNICLDALREIWPSIKYLLGTIFSRPEDIKQNSMNAPEPIQPPVVITPSPDTMLPWDNLPGSVNNRHNVRILCDLGGLSLQEKNEITACIKVESDFETKVEGRINDNGSHDWGIVQINDGNLHGVPLWIGPGAYFESVQEVLDNPTKCVNLMISEWKAGHKNWWISYKSGAYLKYMPMA